MGFKLGLDLSKVKEAKLITVEDKQKIEELTQQETQILKKPSFSLNLSKVENAHVITAEDKKKVTQM